MLSGLRPTVALVLVTSILEASSSAVPPLTAATRQTAPTTVLFLCPHGAAKSVLASAYFQRLAKERGLNVRVEAAGIEPDAAVSPKVAAHLRHNGYPVPVTEPRTVTKEDLTAADVVISMGCELGRLPASPRRLQRWDEIPGPGENFAGADEAIRRRVIALVDELIAQQQK
jgi:arsenate reductase (thioredoxin)